MVPPMGLIGERPPEEIATMDNVKPQITTVAAPHAASQPFIVRENVADNSPCLQNSLECAAQRFVPEHESIAQRLVRQHALAAQQ
jgi:hypothetical protein